MIIKLLTEHHLEFLILKGGCRGSSESTHVKMSNCWKSHALAHLISSSLYILSAQLHMPVIEFYFSSAGFEGHISTFLFSFFHL